jgi:HEAT repeat protein
MQQKIADDLNALADPDRTVRLGAVRRLGAAGGSAVHPLIGAMDGAKSDEYRWYAALALSRIGEPAVDPLIGALRSTRNPDFRRYAAAALGHMGEPAVDPLIRAMKGADPGRRGFLSAGE